MKKRILFVALLMASAVAQSAYKCRDGGRTYFSDSPDCIGEVGDSVPATNGNGASQSPVELGRMLCAGRPADQAQWQDWEGMDTEHIGGGEMVAVKYAGTNMSARRYFRRSPGKSRFGGSSGSSRGGCYTSVDGRRLLNPRDVDELN